MAQLAVVSFRLGMTDGVSIEAAKWIKGFQSLGHDVRTVAGEGPVDALIPGLAIGAVKGPQRDEIVSALVNADVVVVENICSLPLNPDARDVLYEVLHELSLIHISKRVGGSSLARDSQTFSFTTRRFRPTAVVPSSRDRLLSSTSSPETVAHSQSECA